MNTIKKSILLLGLVAFTFASCVQDLDVVPKDPNNIQYFDQNGIFTKIYATLATTGQTGPDGNKDIEGLDEGVSAFIRMIFELNEFPTDEGWWIWDGDAGLPDLRVISWTSVNPLISGIYYRLYFDISLCNHFLENASADGQGAAEIAEVRLIRALNYYYLLDMFGSVPFALEVSEDAKPQLSRKELYAWLELELKDLEGTITDAEFESLKKTTPKEGQYKWDAISRTLPAARLSDYRVDKVAAQMLLTRLYLNAEVYIGEAQWAKAEEYADKVINSQYKLHMTSAEGNYSAYQELFMGDNHKYIGGNGEGILNIYQDGIMCQSWGGARFYCSAFRDAGYNYFGLTDTWSCFRSSPELLAKFMDIDEVGMDTIYKVFKEVKDGDSVFVDVPRHIAKPQYRGDEFQTPAIFKDNRAIFFSWKGNNASDVLEMNGPANNGKFYECWSVLKWTGRYSTQKLGGENVQGHSPDWPDTDVPFIRVAEAYMSKAEALYHQGKKADALSLINTTIRARANAAPLADLDEKILCDEWSREFYCEGRRRTDLVRLGFFTGPQADAHGYTWEGRGAAKSGDPFVSLDKKYNIFPLPASDVQVQHLTQADGY